MNCARLCLLTRPIRHDPLQVCQHARSLLPTEPPQPPQNKRPHCSSASRRMADGPRHRRELGMLVVVVLKAQHLADPHRFSKQDPLVELEYDSRRERTQVDKGGGQTPLWDEEFRFRIFEAEGEQQYLHVRVMREERKDEVELIGEAKILVDGSWREFDEWVQVKEGGKYRGEVYLEATFYPAIQQPVTNLQRRPSKLDPSSRLSRIPAVLPPSLQPGMPMLAHRLSATSLREVDETAPPVPQKHGASEPGETGDGLLPLPGEPDSPELPPTLRPSQAPTTASSPALVGLAGIARVHEQHQVPARLPTPGTQEYLPHPHPPSPSPHPAVTGFHYSPTHVTMPDSYAAPAALYSSPSPAPYSVTPQPYANHSSAPPPAHYSPSNQIAAPYEHYPAPATPSHPPAIAQQYQPSPHLVVSAPPVPHPGLSAEPSSLSPPPVPPRPSSTSPSPAPSQLSPPPAAPKPRRSPPPPPPPHSPSAHSSGRPSIGTSPSPPPRPATSRPLPPNPAGNDRPSLSPPVDTKAREASSSSEPYRAPPPAYSPSESQASPSLADAASRQSSLEAQRQAEAQKAEEAARAREEAERRRQQREEEELRKQREKEERAAQIERERIKRVEAAQRALAEKQRQEQEDARMAAQLAAEAEEAERRKEEEQRAADEAVRRLMEEERAEEERRRREREAADEAFIRELREEEARREAEERRAREDADAAMAQRLREEEEQERQRRLVEDERIARSLAEQDGAGRRRMPDEDGEEAARRFAVSLELKRQQLLSLTFDLRPHASLSLSEFRSPTLFSLNMDGSAAAMSGLGITFEPQPVYYEVPQLVQPPYYAQQPQYAHPSAPHGRRLLHSVSHDDGLRHYMYAQQQYMVMPTDYSPDSVQKRVRIAAGTPEVLNGKGGYLPYDPNHLSPLSDLDPSSTSETGSSQPFSPASLSSLPSSTESGAYATFRHPSQPSPPVYPIRHEPSHTHEHDGGQRILLHANQPLHHSPTESRQTSRPSRLPAFLQERQAPPVMQRPRSMVDLRASQKQTAHGYVRVDRPLPDLVDSTAVGQPGDPDWQGNSEKPRMRQSEGRPRRLPPPAKPPSTDRVRSRSLSAQELRQLAHADASREQGASAGTVVRRESGRADAPHEEQPQEPASSADPFVEGSANADLRRQPTLLTTGASTVRRRKELDRLLAPSQKHLSFGSFASSHERDEPSPASSSETPASHRRAASESSVLPTSLPSPAALEGAKGPNRARVDLDLVLETPLIVEGGHLKGRLDVRIRQPRGREEAVWISKPKIRILGFEELSSGDGRYVFFHHAATVDSPSASHSPLPCFDSDSDEEDFHRARVGQHNVPVEMLVPIGRGAKGPWKGKQGVVRYIAIASIKLKSKNGSDRSIAHFYRHVDVFPYFNPALVLAPAVAPLSEEASKAMFMGGNGRVSLRATMHRGIWVAGQRCYVNVRVENESSKKVKALTLSLIRTTAIYRSDVKPSPVASPDLYGFVVDKGASSSKGLLQSTKKKVADMTLEVGKKGTKGVTAKGTWLGVEAGECADFAPSLLVPADALTIPRGRHLEITYAVRVSVGGSLSADVAVEIPIRIVDFVSLDPPPGHVGPSPLPERPQRPVARSWSSNQLRDVSNLQGRTLPHKPSNEHLTLDDLNGITQPAAGLSRISSLASVRTADLPRDPQAFEDDESSGMSHVAVDEHDQGQDRSHVLVDRARQRQLRHQTSLQCISTAIASATARRQGVVRQPSLLSYERREEATIVEESGAEDTFGGATLPEADYGVQLDDLDDIPDGLSPVAEQTEHVELVCEGEHDEELDMLMQSRFSDDEDAANDVPYSHRFGPAPSTDLTEIKVTPPTPAGRRFSLSIAPASSSPVKAPSVRPGDSPNIAHVDSPSKSPSDKFAFATPTSPVKARVEMSPTHSPGRQATRSAASPLRQGRPLPTPPAARSEPPAASEHDAPTLRKTPSGASLRRNPGILRKAASTRSLRTASSPTESVSSYESSRAASVARSPSLASPRVSPIIASGTTAKFHAAMSPPSAMPSSPARKVVQSPSPALRATRSMAELRATSSAKPVSPRKSTVLPSVQNKVAALETRQATLTRLATQTAGSGRARVSNVQLARADSIMSNASSVAPSEFNLKRADSMASFKAPLFRRGVEEMPPPMPSLPLSHYHP
ncbi:Merlin [Rhodotorula toruloides]|nr:Merlin [Rhodotorula toruloides]KAJ8295548.1 Merlin [Rhodotorula toruloides]